MLYALGYLFWVVIGVVLLIWMGLMRLYDRYMRIYHPQDSGIHCTPEQEKAWEELHELMECDRLS